MYLLAGLRWQGIHQTSTVTFPPYGDFPNPKLDASALTPRLGLLWQPRPWLSLYGNAADNFGPNSPGYITPNGATVPPTAATQWELGAKGAFLRDKVTATLAYFSLTKTNIPTPDLANPDFVLVTGAARSNGIEFDLQGTVAPRWDVEANYDNMTAIVTQSNDPANPVGAPLGEVPRYVDHLWVTHAFPSETHGWRLGAGLTVNGPAAYLYAGNSGLTLPSYALVDAMASYSFNSGKTKIKPQINVSNAFNRRYFGDAQNQAFTTVAPYTAITALYGSPVQVTGALSVQF